MKYLGVGFMLMVCLCVLVAGCSRDRQEGRGVPSPAALQVLETTTVLATITDGTGQGSPSASSGASQSLFSELGRGVAYKVERSGAFLVIHNGKPGKPYQSIDDAMAISRDGSRLAYGALSDGKWRMVVDGVDGMPCAGVSKPRFSPDGRHFAYVAHLGEGRCHLVVDGSMADRECPEYFDLFFSKDSTRVIAIEIADRAHGLYRVVISDLSFGNMRVREVPTGNLVLNRDRTRMAAVVDAGGRKKLVELGFDDPDAVHEGPLFDSISQQAFGDDGVTVAYIAELAGTRYLVVGDRKERLPDGEILFPPVPRPDRTGAGVILRSKRGDVLHLAFAGSTKKAKRYDEAAFLAYSRSGDAYVHAARNGKRMFLVVNGHEGPAFDKVLAPVFSPDGRLVVCRVRTEGKRFVVVLDTHGRMVHRYTEHEMVFNPVFTADGQSVAYGVMDGQQLVWKVEKL